VCSQVISKSDVWTPPDEDTAVAEKEGLIFVVYHNSSI
jgi:hypothetical protein